MSKYFDVNSVSYDAVLIDQSGAQYPLTNSITSLRWEDQDKELAQRATFSLAVNDDSVLAVTKLNTIVVISASWNTSQKQKVFQGFIWDWAFSSGSHNPRQHVVFNRFAAAASSSLGSPIRRFRYRRR